MQTSIRKLPTEHECPDDIHELKDEKECSKDHVLVKEALRKSLVQASANTTKKGVTFRSHRRDREDITDKGLDRVGGGQQVEDNLLDNDFAAVVAMLTSALCQRTTVNKVATSSTFNARRFSDATLGTGGDEIRSSPLERKPLLQITVY
jgi:hypothetical protein